MSSSVSSTKAQPPFYVGVDVGGTNIKFGLLDDRGQTLTQTSIPTDEEKGADDAVSRMARTAHQLAGQAQVPIQDVAAVGLATPGTMDIPAGMLVQPHNLPHWWNYPIRDRLQEAVGKPVSYANDANAAAFGEYWVGSGSEFFSIVLLTLGTGVGGGIILGDLSIDGENSHGGECGHIIIDYHDSARLCGCGQHGHLEAYASATAVVQRIEEALATGNGATTSLRARLDAGAELTTLLLAEEAEQGDDFALDIIMETATYLAIGIVTLMHTIDPGAVVLGGAMNFGGEQSDLGRRFIERVRQEVRSRAFPTLAQRTPIQFATLGGDAGYIGAAGIARAAHQNQRSGP